MKGAELRKKMAAGERVYGTHIVNLGNPLTVGWVTGRLPLDYAFICSEHIPIDRTEISAMCHTFKAAGISPLVRIPVPTAAWANMAIEAGAEGIAGPYVETVDQVRELVGSVRYRPLKGRQLADVLDGAELNPAMTDYIEQFNRDLYLVIGVESVEAVEQLEELASVPGVDGVYIGPHDLTCSMGIPEQYTHPSFVEVVLDVIRRCRALGKGVGVLLPDVSGAECRPYFEAGMNLVQQGADVTNMMQGLGGILDGLRSTYDDRHTRSVEPDAAERDIAI